MSQFPRGLPIVRVPVRRFRERITRNEMATKSARSDTRSRTGRIWEHDAYEDLLASVCLFATQLPVRPKHLPEQPICYQEHSQESQGLVPRGHRQPALHAASTDARRTMACRYGLGILEGPSGSCASNPRCIPAPAVVPALGVDVITSFSSTVAGT